MRRDEKGNACPSTLGEYYDLCKALRADSMAVAFLENKIADSILGREEPVVATDLEMRQILMPMLLKGRDELQ